MQWVLGGYSLAFGPGRVIGSLSWAGLLGVGAEAGPYSATIPHLAFAGFQAMFAGITVALISGAMVERIRFHVYVVFALLWTTFVYDPLAHWVWASDGWLHTLGALDFAGGTVVHISAGTAALVAAAMLGQRRDFGRTTLRAAQRRVHAHGRRSALGRLARIQRRLVARRRRNRRARAREHARGSGAAALIAWLIDRLPARRSGDGGGRGDGRGGRARGNYACGRYVSPLSAIAIGVLGAGASYAAVQLRGRTSIDDALDVFACHGVAGVVGALLTGVFASKSVNPAGADGLIFGNRETVRRSGVGCRLHDRLYGAGDGVGARATASRRIASHSAAERDVRRRRERAWRTRVRRRRDVGARRRRVGNQRAGFHSDDEGRHANVGSRVGAGAGDGIAAPLLTNAATVRPTRSPLAPSRRARWLA